MVTKKCPACGSEKIIPNASLVGVYHVNFEGNPAAFMFKDRKWGGYLGEICGDCGVITLRADDPKKMWDEYQQTVQGGQNATTT
jgi:hypothetical protein